MTPAIVNGAAGAPHVLNTPVTTTISQQVSADLLTNEIDNRIVKIRPMATPVDQISRMSKARHSKSMITEYYSVDTTPFESEVARDKTTTRGSDELKLDVKDLRCFSETDTVLIPAAECGGKKGIMFYVDSVTDSLNLLPIGLDDVAEPLYVYAGSKVIRMGRAAAEMDVQTTHAQAMPVKQKNYCQIFKAQVEQSMLQRQSAKEVGWTLTDQQEVALIDMRMGMEKNFLFGTMHRFEKGPSEGAVFMTQGIWNQTDNEFHYLRGSLTAADLVKLSRQAFTGNAGSSRKILIGGSGFIEALSALDTVKVIGATETVTRWGIDFTEIHTKFGRLYVVLSEIFDACGHEDDAMIIDPEYLQKYTHIPFKAMPIDLLKSGQRNSEAVVLTEASCLVLRYPGAHLRVIADDTAGTGDSSVTPGGDDGDEEEGGEG